MKTLLKNLDSLISAKNFDEAEEIILSEIENFKGTDSEKWLWIKYCKIAEKKQNYDEMIERANLLMEKYPERFEGYRVAASVNKEMGNFDEAEQLINLGLENIKDKNDEKFLLIELDDISKKRVRFNNSNIKISVVIPVYNDSSFLRDCLDSVISQSLSEIEIICVDDCSLDDSADIIREYQSKDHRIKAIFNKINKSALQARKEGVKKSTGKYIIFVDGDDKLSHKDSLLKAYDYIEKEKVDMVHFGTDIVNCAKVPQSRIDMNKGLVKPFLGKLLADEENKNLVSCFFGANKKAGFQLWNKIYDGYCVRLAFNELEEGDFPKANDLYAFFLIAFFSETYFGVDEALYTYNFGVGSTGQNFIDIDNFSVLISEKKVYDALLSFLNGKNLIKNYEEISQSIYDGFLNECVFKWRDNLIYSEKSEGFNLLCNTFGFQDVLCLLAKSDWDPNLRIGKIMKELPFFNYKKKSKNKKNIALYYRCIANGGAQNVVAMLCNRLADMKDTEGNYLYNVILVTDVRKEKDEYFVSDLVKRAFVPDFSTSKRENYKERFIAWSDIISKFDIDLVISSLWVDAVTYYDMLTIKGHSKKPAFVIHSHNFCAVPFTFTGETTPLSQIYKYEISDGVVALSQSDELYCAAFNNYTQYIPNPLAFNPKNQSITNYYKNSIIWVGRISEEKQPLDAIRAMRFVVDEIPDAKLTIVGSGNNSLINQMKNLITFYGLEGNVALVGFTLDTRYYYEMSSIMICTSLYEGFPLTIGEGLSFGIPIVSYDMPWLSYFEDGRGLITVPQQRYELLAKEVIRLLKDRDEMKKIGLEGRKQIEELSEIDINSMWKNFIENIPENRNSKVKKNPTQIVFRYMTEYQYIGKTKIINTKNQEIKKLKDQIITLGKK